MKKLFAVLLALVFLFSAVSALADTWICSECGKESEGNFCSWCGSARPPEKVVCPSCGTEFDAEAGYAFCNNCGASLQSHEVKPVSVGDIVTFGTYPQTAEGTDQTPIEWIVLDIDEANHKAFLLSRYGLEAKSYNAKRGDVTWETCSLRAWLNSDFLNKAFSAEEQSAILTTEVDNSAGQGYSGWSTDGGSNTQDKIFLLSYAEANRYLSVTFEDSNNTLSRVAPTDYAIKNGAWSSRGYKTEDGKPAGWWWLRSPGYYQYDAALVRRGGSLNGNSVDCGDGVVRPALWVDLNSGIF